MVFNDSQDPLPGPAGAIQATSRTPQNGLYCRKGRRVHEPLHVLASILLAFPMLFHGFRLFWPTYTASLWADVFLHFHAW